MSYTPSLEGDVTGPTAATILSKIQGHTVTAPAPVAGQALTYNGVAWVPQTGATPTDALAASLVFRAAGPTAGNVFATWALLYAAFLTTDGPVTIAIDTAPGGVVTATNIPAGAYNMQGRAKIVAFSARETAGSPPYINVLTVADGGIFTDLPEISGALKVVVNPQSNANAPFTYTAACSRLILSHGATLATAATAIGAVLAAPAGVFTMELFDETTIDTSASTTANGVFVTLTPTSTFQTFSFDLSLVATQTAVPAVGFAIGAAGSALKWFTDAAGLGYFGPGLNGFPTSGSGYAGTAATLNLLDVSQGVQYNPVFAAAPHPPGLTIGGVLVVQAQNAIDALNTNENEKNTQTVTNAVTPYTIDVTSAPIQDQAVLQNIPGGGGNIILPAIVPGNHREITVKEITGTVVGSSFTVTASGGNLVDNSPLGLPPAAALAAPAVPWQSLTFKSDGVNTWWIV
jgi:hypothetical protein